MSPDRLTDDRATRDAHHTPEPVAIRRPRRRLAQHAPSFVVQAHAALRFHHDLRLERDGVLVSWAVPKGVPAEAGGRNRLAVQTEDHPLEYAAFEGTIPAGEYGAGDVVRYDHGSYELLRWDEREVKVVLHGARLEGTYVLIHTDARNWLLHKMDASP